MRIKLEELQIATSQSTHQLI